MINPKSIIFHTGTWLSMIKHLRLISTITFNKEWSNQKVIKK